jgi:hypothetical protein
MKISKREDIEAPLDVVFRAVTDFAAFERSALRRGIEVSRRDELDTPGPGMAWRARAPIRNKPRDISIRLVGWTPQTAMLLNIDSNGVLATMTVDLVELSRARTRLQVGVELKAVTMTSKLLLQSMKLAKASLDRKFAKRIGDFAQEIEQRHQKAARNP